MCAASSAGSSHIDSAPIQNGADRTGNAVASSGTRPTAPPNAQIENTSSPGGDAATWSTSASTSSSGRPRRNPLFV